MWALLEDKAPLLASSLQENIDNLVPGDQFIKLFEISLSALGPHECKYRHLPARAKKDVKQAGSLSLGSLNSDINILFWVLIQFKI